jgi:CheY-like chemotaxis protein
MPIMDGFEATRRIRQQHPELPIIAMTAHASPEDQQRCLAAGMTAYLAKPFNAHELYDVVETAAMSSAQRSAE